MIGSTRFARQNNRDRISWVTRVDQARFDPGGLRFAVDSFHYALGRFAGYIHSGRTRAPGNFKTEGHPAIQRGVRCRKITTAHHTPTSQTRNLNTVLTQRSAGARRGLVGQRRAVLGASASELRAVIKRCERILQLLETEHHGPIT